MTTKYSRVSLSAAVVAAFLCGLIFASGFDLTRFGWAQSRVSSSMVKPIGGDVSSAAETETAFEAVADHARPAVVSIEIQHYARQRPNVQRRGGRGQQLPPGIEQFFRDFQDQQQPDMDQAEEASGSGFIVSPDGYILTNNHVVADADKVTVTLFDKRVYDAKVIGKDPTTDVAVVKIDEKNLPTLNLGDDSKARVGQWVLAIGNPLQLDFTVTAGIVSAKGRNQSGLLNPDGRNSYAITDYIQTDAAINPGNSGGPLLNIRGDVIGIDSAIASGTGYYAGYGFAIPITLAQQVMNDLIKFGKVRRAVVGVSLNEVTATDARAAGLAQIGGAKVSGFNPENDSPAQKAGIEIGDIITAAGGKPIDQVTTLQRIIRGYKPGDMVTVDVMRFGQKRSFSVKLGEPPEAVAAVASNAEDSVAPASDANGTRRYDKLGISISAIPDRMAQQANLPAAYRSGLMITSVSPQGPSYHNLFENEVIVQELYPSKHDIRSADDLQAAMSSLKAGDVIELKVVDVVQGTPQTRAVSVAIAK
ncbi:MAG TPA: trypsin-like peptidase domain-containing protein [Gemmatimonadaceae bacterium]|nr:trypsin-like peptidase domain-containing protein [Gemmatimonadaceae bacterium]